VEPIKKVRDKLLAWEWLMVVEKFYIPFPIGRIDDIST
jgi:hypothetical protein